MSFFGPKLPLRTGNSIHTLTYNIQEQLRYNLLNLIMTNPGEKISDVDFGVGIAKTLFELQTSSAMSTLQARIQQQVNRFMPFVKIKNITAAPGDSNTTSLTILYAVTTLNIVDYITILNLKSEKTGEMLVEKGIGFATDLGLYYDFMGGSS
jgi:phage baseplate assembly protein W